LNAEKWHSIQKKEILKAGGNAVLKSNNGSHIKALIKLYPELRLKKKNFLQSVEGWKEPERQRKFFENFAISKAFDPLDAEKWYSIHKREILEAGGSGLLNYYKGSLTTALIKLYPELMLQRENFRNTQKMGKQLRNADS